VKENGEIVWVDEDDQIVPAPTLSRLLKGHTVLAIAGNVWQRTKEESISAAMHISDFYRVFGRCTPNDKADIIGAFIDRGIVCSMVGDGGAW
jgi:magnesium-transporting ATPase (P-type)